MESSKLRVAITHGDTNGVGYELIFKTFAEPEMLELCTPIIYGSPKVAAYHRKALDIQASFSIVNSANDAKGDKVNILPTFDDEIKVDMGQATPESGLAALKALDRAMTDFREGSYDVLVTAPMSPRNINPDGYTFPGQTKYIETCLGEGKKAFNIFVYGDMRMAFMTFDEPFASVASLITKDNVVERIKQLHHSLQRDFRISNPRIAVLALNPTSHENEAPGREEQEAIVPAIEELSDQGIQAFGPYPADTYFSEHYDDHFDAVLAMYYDQGIIPLRTLSAEPGIVYTAGLPVVRTAPDVTPLYHEAGKNEMDASAMRHAIFAAIDIVRNREMFDEATANPLKKLYREKRDDSEKVRFAIPKK